MRRRTFLTRIAAALAAIAAAPLVSDALHWKDGAGLYQGTAKVYPQYLYLTTPFAPESWMRDMFEIPSLPDYPAYRAKLDWPLTVKFDDATMLRLTRERMLKDLAI